MGGSFIALSERQTAMKILYVVNNAAFFCSHRLPIALAARQSGHEVGLITGQAGSATMEVPAVNDLQRRGLEHRRVAFRSGGASLPTEVQGLAGLWHELRRQLPDLVHCASPKGVLYGGLAARASGVPALVLSISGMGSLFTGVGGCGRRLARRVYLALLRWVLAHPRCCVVVQNADDRALLIDEKLTVADRIMLIPGSGVDLSLFDTVSEQERADLIVLPGRLLWEKGVGEFVEAARQLRGRGWRFALVGTADYDNPSSIGETQVRRWVDEGVVEWWGHRSDMHRVFAEARIVCLPSYREGMPKALLEAAAAGCAIVTTDTIGCREAIAPGRTGELVPVGDATALARALDAMMRDPQRMRCYGDAGRLRAFELFDQCAVIQTTLTMYEQLLPAPAPAAANVRTREAPSQKDTP